MSAIDDVVAAIAQGANELGRLEQTKASLADDVKHLTKERDDLKKETDVASKALNDSLKDFQDKKNRYDKYVEDQNEVLAKQRTELRVKEEDLVEREKDLAEKQSSIADDKVLMRREIQSIKESQLQKSEILQALLAKLKE